ncbi:MAG: His-Xaa-Ser system radical SAM maturase HxsB [Elusimicrobia bacterium]|nr:His-Xaa-Ser system radical SAM maturase HxsB [Elusimicrobiota bacterium]
MKINFEKIGKKYFLSSEDGDYILLSKKEFSDFKKKESIIIKKGKRLIEEKQALAFCENYNSLKKYSFSPASLHIVVLTHKCNHACVYCRASKFGESNKPAMDEKTAEKTADFILSTPSKNITVEFQGGEAFLNWDILVKSVNFLKKKNIKAKKDLEISVVTNLSLADEKKLLFLEKEGVSVCTSLDGPAEIHDKNRLYFSGSSYALTEKWLKFLNERASKKSYAKDSLPSALMTTTRFSLNNHKEIIDCYEKLKLGGIFLRPLSPIGYAKNVWDKIGYEPRDFLKFYEKALDYILEKNLKGIKFIERNAAIKLNKILFSQDPNFLDLRSPCGAALGQLAYDCDGSIYTCDEGRMTASAGDDFFKVGNVFNSSYKEVLNSPAAKICSICSCLENQPSCFRCPFKQWCGVCPVHNYETSKSPWGNKGFSGWCEIEKGIFKILIERIENKKYLRVFRGWF